MHRPGREHLIVDYLSRLELGEPPEGIPDDLLDADLFLIQVTKSNDWYEQMLNYLAEGIFPEGMTKDHMRKLVLRSVTYSVIGGYLYKRGVDHVIKRCIPDSQQAVVLTEAHAGSFGGHFSGDITSCRKIF